MTLNDDITAAMANAETALTDLATRVDAGDDADAATIAAVTAQRDALQLLVDAGGGATNEQLQVILNSAIAITNRISGMEAA